MSLTTRKLLGTIYNITANGSVSGASTKLSVVFEATSSIYGTESKSGIEIYADDKKLSPTWTVNKSDDFMGTTKYTKLTSSAVTVSKPFFTLRVSKDGSDIYEGMFSFYEIEKAGSKITASGGLMDGETKSEVKFDCTSTDATYKAAFTLDTFSETASSATSNLNYVIPINWCNALPDTSSGTASITGKVLFGGKVYKSFNTSLIVTVPTVVAPSISSLEFSDTDDTPVPSSWGIYVQNESGIKLKSIGCEGAYGSSIETVKLTADSKISTSEYPSLPEIEKISQSGDVSIMVTVTDSRGRSFDKSVSLPFVAYSAPKFLSVKSERCDKEGNTDNDGTYFLSTTSVKYSPCSGKNSVSLSVKYKRTDLSSYGSENEINEGSNVCASGDLNPEYSYDVLYTLSDEFNRVTYSDYVSTAVYLMHFLHGGRGVAFGQKATLENTLDCNFNAVFRNKLSCVLDDGTSLEVRDMMSEIQSNLAGMLCPDNKLPTLLLNLMYPIGSIYMSVSPENPTNIMGGTWVSWGEGRVPIGVGTGTDENKTSQSFTSANATGGEYSHLLTAGESGQKAVTTGKQSASHTHGTGNSTLNSFQVMKQLSSDETAKYKVGSGTKCIVTGATDTASVGERTATGAQSASHTHTLSGSSAEEKHNNIQPYITCYMWRRTA